METSNPEVRVEKPTSQDPIQPVEAGYLPEVLVAEGLNVFGDGLAIHREVLNGLQNFLLYSPFQRVTNQLI